MFEEIFSEKRMAPEKVLRYGFKPFEGGYKYTVPIMKGDFLLEVILDNFGDPTTRLTDRESGGEYVLYKTDAEGSFVGSVRAEIAGVLQSISENCFICSAFKQPQALQLIEYAAEVFGEAPDFPFKDLQNAGILRRKDNGKWYVAMMHIKKSKLGFDSDKLIEIANLHGSPENVSALLQRKQFFPAWHMNKKTWFTVILDGSVDNGELFALVEESRRLATK